MKKILLLALLLLSTSATLFANDYTQDYETALKLKGEANYQEAVKFFLKALKAKEEEMETARSICFEIANCFNKAGNEKNAIKFIKVAIRNYGATRDDVERNASIDKDLAVNAWVAVAPEFNDLHRIYLLKSNSFSPKEYAALEK